MTDHLLKPKSIADFKVGDEIVCIDSGNYSRQGEHYLVVGIPSNGASHYLSITKMNGNSWPALHGQPLTTSWRRFAKLQDDPDHPNY
jgi:hypothetical protein